MLRNALLLLPLFGCTNNLALAADPKNLDGLVLWLDATDQQSVPRADYQSASTESHLGFRSLAVWKDKSDKRNDARVSTVLPGGEVSFGNDAIPKPRWLIPTTDDHLPIVAVRNFDRTGRLNFPATGIDTGVPLANECTIIVVAGSRFRIHNKAYSSYTKDNPHWSATAQEWDIISHHDSQVAGPTDGCLIAIRHGEASEMLVTSTGPDGKRRERKVKLPDEFATGTSKKHTLKLTGFEGGAYLYLAELLVYHRELSDEELAQVCGPLERKWLAEGALAKTISRARPADPVRANLSDPASWTWPNWSDGFPDVPQEADATIETRAAEVEYLALFEEDWEHSRPHPSSIADHLKTGSLLPRRGGPGHTPFSLFNGVSLGIEIYERTDNEFYLDYARKAFAAYLDGAARGGDFDKLENGRGTGTFKYGSTLARIAPYLKLTAEQRRTARELTIALARYSPPREAREGEVSYDGKHYLNSLRMYACGNHSTRQFAGGALAARALKGDPELQWLIDATEFGWQWYQWKQSVQENDNSYHFYCLNPIIEMARDFGHGINSFRSEGYQKLLTRTSYLTTPAGYYPGFGYAGGNLPNVKQILVAEIAARATSDPSCLYFAQKLNSRLLRQMRNASPSRHGSDGNWIGSYDSAYSSYLLSLPPTNLKPVPPKTLSAVYKTNQWKLDKLSVERTNKAKLSRKIPDSQAPDEQVLERGYDKLVLKTTDAPGGAMIIMDLASRRGGGDKSHPEKRPAILYYEAHQVPLWVGTKYSRASRVHNLVWLTPPDDEFPLQRNVTDPNIIGRIDSRFNNQANPQNLVYGDVFAENKSADAYGHVEFSSYYAADTSLNRRMILTAEGFLVICDQLTPGASVDGFTAGPLWNPYQSRSPKSTAVARGDNWWSFSSGAVMGCDTKDHNAYASDLLLYYARAEGRTIGESRIEPETKGLEHANGWLVTHASETIRKGQPVTFVTVLVPHPRSVSGNVLADSIQVIEKDGGTEVTLSHKRDTVRVKFRQGNRQWSVARQER